MGRDKYNILFDCFTLFLYCIAIVLPYTRKHFLQVLTTHLSCHHGCSGVRGYACVSAGVVVELWRCH